MAKEYYFIFYSILAVILLIGVKPAVKGGWCKDALSLRTSKGLLGFCAVAITRISRIRYMQHPGF